MQVDPIKPTLKAPGTKRLKLKYEKLLSSFVFNFGLRRYSPEQLALDAARKKRAAAAAAAALASESHGSPGRGLHSFPCQLSLSSSVHRIP